MPRECDVAHLLFEERSVEERVGRGVTGVGDHEKVGQAEIGVVGTGEIAKEIGVVKNDEAGVAEYVTSTDGTELGINEAFFEGKPDFSVMPEVDAVETIIVLWIGRMKFRQEFGVGAENYGVWRRGAEGNFEQVAAPECAVEFAGKGRLANGK